MRHWNRTRCGGEKLLAKVDKMVERGSGDLRSRLRSAMYVDLKNILLLDVLMAKVTIKELVKPHLDPDAGFAIGPDTEPGNANRGG